jgi:hypothetical protein
VKHHFGLYPVSTRLQLYSGRQKPQILRVEVQPETLWLWRKTDGGRCTMIVPLPELFRARHQL